MTTLTPDRIQVESSPAELPLFILTVICAAFLWLILAVSILGLIYVGLIGTFFFVAHLVFIAYVRGSGVKLGPEQFPAIHEAVLRLSRGMGLEPPEAYVVQAGGTLNALATRFLGRNMIVLYSDLLEACGENTGARDMIIAHELGHLKCGHLRWQWLILPGYVVPFLGSALSRAREYTCDRFGLAGAGNRADALRGLAILAAGPTFGTQLRLDVFMRQREDVNTGFMTLAEWFASHPPLSKRVAALSPELHDSQYNPASGRLRAAAIVMSVVVAVIGASAAAVVIGQQLSDVFAPLQNTQKVQADFQVLAGFIQEQWPDASNLPETMDEIVDKWIEMRPAVSVPTDPFDGNDYGYQKEGASYQIWSSGLDGKSGTADDIMYVWP